MFVPPGVIEVAKLGSPRAAKPTPAAAEVTRKLRRDIGPISTHGVSGSKHYARYNGIELRLLKYTLAEIVTSTVNGYRFCRAGESASLYRRG
jgi:hypothetical protein